MLPKQKQAYDSFKKRHTALLDSGTAMALDPLTELTRLTQLASACADVNAADEFRLCLPSSKVEALLELLEDMGEQQLVVFAVSRQLIDIATAVLEDKGIPCSVVVGGQTDYARQSAIDEFQAGRARVILLTLGAGSEAITLTAASTVCFLQRSWSMVQNRQAEDRVHRIGQSADKVVIIDLVAPNTVEEHIAAAVEAKGDMLEEITRDKESIRRMLNDN
jgi:SNF2 family DNA or RNA helicase